MDTRLAILTVMFSMSGMLTLAKADSVSLFSSAATTTNSTASATQDIDTHPSWAGYRSARNGCGGAKKAAQLRE